jgi:hypothetical protein
MRTEGRLRTLAVILAASVATACSNAAPSAVSDMASRMPPSSSPSTALPASSRPTVAVPATTPVPTVPPLATEATAQRHGVEIHLELERNPLPAGQQTWATVTIRNRSDKTVPWMTDGCEITASVYGILGGDWVGGVAQTGIAARFKSFALEPFGHSGNGYLGIGFQAEQYLGRDVGCADVGIPHELRAGQKLVHRGVWDGKLGDLAPADGPLTIVPSFPVHLGDIGFTPAPVEVRLESWITGGTSFEFLTPAAAIDVALGDARFREWLERAPASTWINSHHTLEPDAGTWEIGLFREDQGTHLGMVTLDARTGEVLKHRFE